MKLVVIVDNNIKMSKGKLARQVAGAVTLSLIDAFFHLRIIKLIKWMNNGIKTIVLKSDCTFETTLIGLELINIKYFKMIDAGKTQFNGVPTLTCICTELILDKQNKYLDTFKLL